MEKPPSPYAEPQKVEHLQVPSPPGVGAAGAYRAPSPVAGPPKANFANVLHPELELDRYRQTLIELASRHIVLVLLTVLGSTYVALHLTQSKSGVLLLALAPAVIVAYVLRARLEQVSRERFDQHFARVAHGLAGSALASPVSAPQPAINIYSPTSSVTSTDSGYETGPPSDSAVAMPAFVPHRLSPVLSVSSSQEVDDGHRTPSQRTPSGVNEADDYMNARSRPSSYGTSVRAVENAGTHRTSTLRPQHFDNAPHPDEHPWADPRALVASPESIADGDLLRRTGLGVPYHHRLSTIQSNEEMRFGGPSLRAGEDGRNNRDSTYTTLTDTSTRAVENASLGRTPTTSSHGTSARAVEDGGLSRSTTASGGTGASTAAVENGGGGARKRGPPAKRASRSSERTDDTGAAVEDWRASSGGTVASDRATENASHAGHAPSLGGSSVRTHSSTHAVENGGHRSAGKRGQAFASFASLSPREHDGGRASPWLANLSPREHDGGPAAPCLAHNDGRPPMEAVNSGDTVHTIGSTDAVEDDEDGGSPTKAAFAFRLADAGPVPPTAHDYARPDEEMSVLEGDDAEPEDGELSSTESDESAESAGTAGSALRRRGGIRARRPPRRALSQATTAATTMEAHPDGHTRTTEWLKGHGGRGIEMQIEA